MKMFKKLGCIAAVVLCAVLSLSFPVSADDMSLNEWSIQQYYQVNSKGVMAYSSEYICYGGEQQIETKFQKGDIVYASYGCSTMGITWACCFSLDPYEGNSTYYGWVDMAYLSPVGTVTEAPIVTDPPTEPPTEPPTTITTTTEATTVQTTAETTTTTAITTEDTTTTVTTTEPVSAAASQDDDHDSHGSFFSKYFVILLIGGIVVLAAGSGVLAIVLIHRSQKKTAFSPDLTEDTARQTSVKKCPYCGVELPGYAGFCKSCGKPVK